METLAEYYLDELFKAGLSSHNSLTTLQMRRRHRSIIEAKYALFWLLRRDTDFTVIEIGKFFFNDHSTVCYAVGCVNEKETSPIKEERKYYEALSRIPKFPKPELTFNNSEVSSTSTNFETSNKNTMQDPTLTPDPEFRETFVNYFVHEEGRFALNHELIEVGDIDWDEEEARKQDLNLIHDWIKDHIMHNIRYFNYIGYISISWNFFGIVQKDEEPYISEFISEMFINDLYPEDFTLIYLDSLDGLQHVYKALKP